jgi:hypothetical protein
MSNKLEGTGRIVRKYGLATVMALILVFSFQVLVFAAENSSSVETNVEKKNVVLIVANKSKVSSVTQKQIDNLLLTPIPQNLQSHYNVSVDMKYYEKFKAIGYDSIAATERADIIDVFKEENIDYAILIEFLPNDSSTTTTFVNGLSIPYTSFTYHAHMKIVDIKANKYLYNGTFSRDNRVKPMADKMITIINEKLGIKNQ